jgi:hypothetical protein
LFVFATAIEITAVHFAGRAAGKIARARKINSASRILLPAAFVAVNLIMALIYFG